MYTFHYNVFLSYSLILMLCSPLISASLSTGHWTGPKKPLLEVTILITLITHYSLFYAKHLILLNIWSDIITAVIHIQIHIFSVEFINLVINVTESSNQVNNQGCPESDENTLFGGDVYR